MKREDMTVGNKYLIEVGNASQVMTCEQLNNNGCVMSATDQMLDVITMTTSPRKRFRDCAYKSVQMEVPDDTPEE